MMNFQTVITFLLWMLRRWPIYENDFKFYELSKNPHHVTPNSMHTQNFSFVGLVAKLCEKPILHTQNLLGRIWLINDVLTFKIAKTYHNPNFYHMVCRYDHSSRSSWKFIFCHFLLGFWLKNPQNWLFRQNACKI